MLALLAESALRSTALGLAVWLGLTLLRVRNPAVRMTAMTVVLAVSLAMPALTPWMKWSLPISTPPTQLIKRTVSQIPWSATDESEPTASFPAARAAPAVTPSHVRKPAGAGDWRTIALGIDVLVSLLLLLQLVIGWALSWRRVKAARRIDADWGRGTDIRVSDAVAVPVTFASTIVLPSAYRAWSERKLRAVLLHERAHVSHGDSYVLWAAAIHRALFWFNPFSWWLLHRLAELAELVSDDAAIRGIDDPLGYAEILLDVARNPQQVAGGLAMARQSTVRQRVERILSLTTVSARVPARKRLLIAVVLVPPAIVSASTVAFVAAPTKATGVLLARPQAARPTIDLPPEILDRYAGHFQTGVMSVLTITREDEGLFAQATGEPRMRLLATSDREFVGSEDEIKVTFVPADGGPASDLVFSEPDTVSRKGVRIDATTASDIDAAFQRRIAAAPDRFTNQAPMPGGEATLRRAIEQWRSGSPNYAQMSPQLADDIRKRLPRLDAMFRALGALQSISFKGVGPAGMDLYSARFDHGSVEVALALAPEGRLESLFFDPQGDSTPGGVADCALESTLSSSKQDSAPVRLLLTNRSGADLRLFGLDLDGHRLAQGRLATEEARYIISSVAHPLVVTDTTGQCLEIVLPGQQTRFHVVEPSGTATITPTTAGPDGEKVLRQYIDSVLSGNPAYDQMTPQVAAGTRKRFRLQQALLAKLGALQSISFQGLSETGNLYAVRFANGSTQWQIRLSEEGRIAALSLGPPLPQQR